MKYDYSQIDRKGIKNPNSKLSNEDILRIRLDKRKLKDIAKDYAVSSCLIGMVRRKLIWTHI